MFHVEHPNTHESHARARRKPRSPAPETPAQSHPLTALSLVFVLGFVLGVCRDRRLFLTAGACGPSGPGPRPYVRGSGALPARGPFRAPPIS